MKKMLNITQKIGFIANASILVSFILMLNRYLTFIGIEQNIYKGFYVYYAIWLCLSSDLSIIRQELYYKGNVSRSNKIVMFIGVFNFIIMVLGTLLTKNHSVVITVAVLFTFVSTLICCRKEVFRRGFSTIPIILMIKHTSFALLRNIMFFITHLFGFRNGFTYGINYMLAMSFDTLTTDAEWDVIGAIDVAVKIDLAKDKLDYQKSRKEGISLTVLLIMIILISQFCLYFAYQPDLCIMIPMTTMSMLSFINYPVNAIKMAYLQIKAKSIKHDIFRFVQLLGRFFISLLPTPYAIYIGMMFASLAMRIYTKIYAKSINEPTNTH